MDDISASLGMTKIVLFRSFSTRDKLIEGILERITDEFLSVDALNIEKYSDRLHRYLDISRTHEDSMRILLLQITMVEAWHPRPGRRVCSLDADFQNRNGKSRQS